MIALVELGDDDYSALIEGSIVYIPVIVAERTGDSAVVRIAAARGDVQIPHEIRLRVPRSTLRMHASQAKV